MNREIHQDPKILEDAVKKIIDKDKKKILVDACDSKCISHELRSIGKGICGTLLDYCSYKIDHKEINPFEDPFVGAMLITDEGQILGAHRKVRNNECHCEAQALINAIESIDTGKARSILENINECYKRVIWSNDDGIKIFLNYFKNAGKIVKNSVRKNRQTTKLILITTLEPCKDFESQPSCASIISAFEPDLVLYACDDTNIGGQGKKLMEDKGLLVVGNLSIEKNLEINNLYYSAVHYLERLQKSTSEMINTFQVRYIITQLNNLKPEWSFKNGRIKLIYDKPVPIPVHQYYIEPDIPEYEDSDLQEHRIIKDRILFATELKHGFLVSFIVKHLHITNKIPGIIVASRGIEGIENEGIENDKFHKFLNRLREIGVKIYPEAFRKKDEHFMALQFIQKVVESGFVRTKLYLFIEREKEEDRFFVDFKTPNAWYRYLVNLKDLKNIYIYITNKLMDPFRAFLGQIKLECGIFGRVNFYVFPFTENSERTKYLTDEIKIAIKTTNYENKFTIKESPLLFDKLNASELRDGLKTGNIDPIIIHDAQWREILNADNWEERREAGECLVYAIRSDSFLYKPLIIDKLAEAFDRERWRIMCSLLNAVAKIGRPIDENDQDELINKLWGIGRRIEYLFESEPSPELVDVTWRYIASLFGVIKDRNEFELLMMDNKLSDIICGNSFLVKELIYYAFRYSKKKNIFLHSLDLIEAQMDSEKLCLSDVIIRISRLFVHLSSDIKEKAEIKINELLCKSNISSNQKESFERETERCKEIDCGGLHSLLKSCDIDPKKIASFLLGVFTFCQKSGS